MLNNLQKELVRGLSEYLQMSSYSELKLIIEKVLEVNESEDDFTIDGLWFNCGSREVRIISESAIDRIWEEGLEELLKDCYSIPKELEGYIDYEKWVNDCKQDGKGHHFSSWDGSEHETENFYYFKN